MKFALRDGLTRRLTSFALVLALCLSLVGTAWAADETIDISISIAVVDNYAGEYFKDGNTYVFKTDSTNTPSFSYEATGTGVSGYGEEITAVYHKDGEAYATTQTSPFSAVGSYTYRVTYPVSSTEGELTYATKSVNYKIMSETDYAAKVAIDLDVAISLDDSYTGNYYMDGNDYVFQYTGEAVNFTYALSGDEAGLKQDLVTSEYIDTYTQASVSAPTSAGEYTYKVKYPSSYATDGEGTITYAYEWVYFDIESETAYENGNQSAGITIEISSADSSVTYDATTNTYTTAYTGSFVNAFSYIPTLASTSPYDTITGASYSPETAYYKYSGNGTTGIWTELVEEISTNDIYPQEVGTYKYVVTYPAYVKVDTDDSITVLSTTTTEVTLEIVQDESDNFTYTDASITINSARTSNVGTGTEEDPLIFTATDKAVTMSYTYYGLSWCEGYVEDDYYYKASGIKMDEAPTGAGTYYYQVTYPTKATTIIDYIIWNWDTQTVYFNIVSDTTTEEDLGLGVEITKNGTYDNDTGTIIYDAGEFEAFSYSLSYPTGCTADEQDRYAEKTYESYFYCYDAGAKLTLYTAETGETAYPTEAGAYIYRVTYPDYIIYEGGEFDRYVMKSETVYYEIAEASTSIDAGISVEIKFYDTTYTVDYTTDPYEVAYTGSAITPCYYIPTTSNDSCYVGYAGGVSVSEYYYMKNSDGVYVILDGTSNSSDAHPKEVGSYMYRVVFPGKVIPTYDGDGKVTDITVESNTSRSVYFNVVASDAGYDVDTGIIPVITYDTDYYESDFDSDIPVLTYYETDSVVFDYAIQYPESMSDTDKETLAGLTFATYYTRNTETGATSKYSGGDPNITPVAPTAVGTYAYAVTYPDTANYNADETFKDYDYAMQWVYYEITEVVAPAPTVTATSYFISDLDTPITVTLPDGTAGVLVEDYTVTYYYSDTSYDAITDSTDTEPNAIGFYKAVVSFGDTYSEQTVYFDISPNISSFSTDSNISLGQSSSSTAYSYTTVVGGINKDCSDGFDYDDFTATLTGNDDVSIAFLAEYLDKAGITNVKCGINDSEVCYFIVNNFTEAMYGTYNFTITLNATGYTATQSSSFTVTLASAIYDIAVETENLTMTGDYVLGKYAVPYVENLTKDEINENNNTKIYTKDVVTYDITYYVTVSGEWTEVTGSDDMPDIGKVSQTIDGYTYYSDAAYTSEILWPKLTETGKYDITFTIKRYAEDGETVTETLEMTKSVILTTSLTQLLDENSENETFYMEAGTLYTLPSGWWSLEGDDGYYCGDGLGVFYVPEDGEYSFSYEGETQP